MEWTIYGLFKKSITTSNNKEMKLWFQLLIANSFYQDIVTHLGRTDRGKCVCKKLWNRHFLSVSCPSLLLFWDFDKMCLSQMCLSPFSSFLLHRSTARRTKHLSTVAQESGFKVFINYSPPAVAVSLTEQMLSLDESSSPLELCPAKYVWQSYLGISSWSAHRSDGSDFKYPLNFLQKENKTSMLSATSTGLPETT